MLTLTTINTDAEARILVHDEEARKAGFSPHVPYFALGTRLVEVGEHNFQVSRSTYEAMPTVTAALEGLIQTVQQEKRHDYDVQSQGVIMLNDGRLMIKEPGEPVAFTAGAFKQFMGRLSAYRNVPNPAAFLSAIDAERRARIVNEELQRAPDTEFKVRVRTPNGTPEIFAAVSQKYTVADADQLAEQLLERVDPSTKAEVLYYGTRSQISLLYHADLMPKDVGVGEFYKASVRLSSDDDGSEAARIRDMLFRALCINLTTAASEQRVVERRHSGDVEKFLAAIAQGLDVGIDKLKFFINAFSTRGRGYDVRELTEKQSAGKPKSDTPAPVFRTIFTSKNKLWSVPGATPEQVVEAAVTAWLKEPAESVDGIEPWSLSGLSNAVSRAAHEGSWSSPEVPQYLEDRAG